MATEEGSGVFMGREGVGTVAGSGKGGGEGGFRGMECQWKGMGLALGPDTARLIQSLESEQKALGGHSSGGVQTHLLPVREPPVHMCSISPDLPACQGLRGTERLCSEM